MTSLKKDFTSEAALQAFAASLGPQLQAGDVLLLDGDLGAGKTSFTKGLFGRWWRRGFRVGRIFRR